MCAYVLGLPLGVAVLTKTIVVDVHSLEQGSTSPIMKEHAYFGKSLANITVPSLTMPTRLESMNSNVHCVQYPVLQTTIVEIC